MNIYDVYYTRQDSCASQTIYLVACLLCLLVGAL
ncbi:hypothetical protein T4B_11492 [Trichinella pseudospiralis]|uniref:Uncharacterized protein n=1 Tax=Trichinella pseudospiralis TaxID=6337 RepID=A0A0V1GMC6_TRIPS|nr:hypothetical protein T4B_11492 [Trichinella pseudospiralis]